MSVGGGDEGGGGSDVGPCDIDCSTIQTPDCQQSVCNTGQYPGTIGQCVVVDREDGFACDDGLFCSVNDTCQNGVCTGGGLNDCGMDPGPCDEITCDESSGTCSTAPLQNGTSCTPENLCEVGGTCTNGICTGVLNDCFFAPVDNDCHIAVCNPMNGLCESQPDLSLDGLDCFTGDLCNVDKVCAAGQCIGGNPKDCSQLNIGCQVGVCDPMGGNCVGQNVPAGGSCFDGVDDCNTGTCDMNGTCVLSPVVDGTSCDDFSTCTTGDTCTAGVCNGVIDPNCTVYFEETFEVCPPPGWTLGGEWECGTPTLVGPTSAYQGTGVLGTDLDSTYENSSSYDILIAETPPIGLGTAVGPVLSYYHYVTTEGSSFDGYNVKVSTDGGNTFTVLTTVNPPYNLTVDSQPAYGGQLNQWQQVTASLNAYVGQQIILRFSMRTDGSVVYPGVYIDNIQVGDGDGIPVQIDTLSLPNALENIGYSTTLAASGGTGNGVWSIVGGTNHSWLGIGSTTGVLSGTPTTSNIGPVTVTVHFEEPTNPSNFDEVTYMFNVQGVVYSDDMETACPGAWTLTGDWQCGAPTSGPNMAFSGTQVIATQLAGPYNNSQTWLGNTASTGPINLAGTTAPTLRAMIWAQTEGSSFDGFNIKVSTDGGVTYNLVNMVTPAYNLTVDTQACWGGSAVPSGYSEYSADLTAYAGQTIHIQFGMRTDGSVTYPGVYIDNLAITD
ncbi:MAG: immune inhibitor A [Myxococcales bacterium]|nr:immune inhibitor A [Myxococcales bacterium]